ncbi:CbtB-domain containing protein [Nocardioides maradonensis]
MSNTSAITPSAGPISTPLVSVNVKTVALLVGVAFLALMAYYFIGIDEGAMSLSGKSMLLHEFFHDGRHLMGFPCH